MTAAGMKDSLVELPASCAWSPAPRTWLLWNVSHAAVAFFGAPDVKNHLQWTHSLTHLELGGTISLVSHQCLTDTNRHLLCLHKETPPQNQKENACPIWTDSQQPSTEMSKPHCYTRCGGASGASDSKWATWRLASFPVLCMPLIRL